MYHETPIVNYLISVYYAIVLLSLSANNVDIIVTRQPWMQ